MRSFSFGLAVILLLAPQAIADTVLLKNGRKVIGEVYDQNKYSIRIRINKIPYTYYLHEIEDIQYSKDVQAQDSYLKYLAVDGGTITEVKAELVRRLLNASGARDSLSKVFNTLVAKAPPEQQKKMLEVLNPDEVIEVLIPVYSKYYTDQELKELLGFYLSATGKKHLELTPKLLDETLKATDKYFENKMKAL